MTDTDLGKFGLWTGWAAFGPAQARDLETLGYGSVWLGGSPPAELPTVAELLAATETLRVGTSVVNIWASPAKRVAESYHALEARFPGRFLLGVGAGHREHTSTYRKPYDALVEYLDELDEAGVPRERRALAALGPRVLRLAGERTAGALPYLTTPEHTRQARAILGPDALLIPEQKIVLDTDPVRARRTARPRVEFYLQLTNYTASLRRLGFTDEELAFPGTDAAIDRLVRHGDADQVADALYEHLAAGANEVAVQVADADPIAALRALAPALAARTHA
ncbi:LLM class F420-dependent oxidoreductase [Nocardia stercoris]|uniref:LLM class F420-dependent oxidoreductase n=1 Tax=Nocardia stercoris TaxID=2483361 RepID=A0A3M2L2N0_9NOCA|nr:LLM class F420-dependent oxidoreductase [Nocardia stercoris]RMI31969.1 LLM class F420-dependent oxidoreductase [Nocardia stercoris]